MVTSLATHVDDDVPGWIHGAPGDQNVPVAPALVQFAPRHLDHLGALQNPTANKLLSVVFQKVHRGRVSDSGSQQGRDSSGN